MKMILVFVLALSMSLNLGVEAFARSLLNNRFPLNRPGFPVNRHRLPYNRPGFGVTLPYQQTTRPPISKPISDEDDHLAAEIGVRLPPYECVISNEQFLQHVVGMDWIAPYLIDNDSPLNPEISYKFNVRWEPINSTFVQRRASFWDDLTKMCGYLDAPFRQIDKEKAIYGAASGGDSFAIEGRADFFLSFDPERYVIFYICYDYNKSVRGRCPNSEILLLVKDQRDSNNDDNGIRRADIVLDDIHWTLIEETFKNCLGQQFVDETDPQIIWAWEFEDCPKPGTSAFESGLSG